MVSLYGKLQHLIEQGDSIRTCGYMISTIILFVS